MNAVERLEKVVLELFGSLESSEQIAQLCRDNLVQGFVGNATSCPMAKLVREKVDFPIAFTMGKKLGTGQFVVIGWDRNVSIPAPYVCDQFSDDFDVGKYQDLIAVVSAPKKEEEVATPPVEESLDSEQKDG